MSTCSGDHETASVVSEMSKKSDSHFVSVIVIVDDDPKLSNNLVTTINNEMKWRGVKVNLCTIPPGCENFQDKVVEFNEIISTVENSPSPSVSVILVRIEPMKAENFKAVLRELNERPSQLAKYTMSLIFTVGVLIQDEVVKTEDLDFSNNGIYLAKYLARELIVKYTRHLGINNIRQNMRTPPIAIFVRETPVVGQKPLSSRLAEALSREPISFVHHRVGYLISQPETVIHLCELAEEHGFPPNDVTNGCKIYLKNALNFELASSSCADVVIVDTLNDIYVDIDSMMEIAKEKAYSTFVMEDANEETVHRIIDTMVWMIKRRCHYTDGPFADYFYTQMSLHKEMDTLRMFFNDSGDFSSEAGDNDSVLTDDGETEKKGQVTGTDVGNGDNDKTASLNTGENTVDNVTSALQNLQTAE